VRVLLAGTLRHCPVKQAAAPPAPTGGRQFAAFGRTAVAVATQATADPMAVLDARHRHEITGIERRPTPLP
jgi:hypothetical protein